MLLLLLLLLYTSLFVDSGSTTGECESQQYVCTRMMIIFVSYFVDILYSGGAIVSIAIAIAIATKRFVLCHFPIQTFVVHCKYNVVRSRGMSQ